jgi:glycosyltransferase involved in cell wall biosynthesis
MSSVDSRTKLSVCMATYNGSRYVHEQIASILPQLEEGDELVVVDDCSQDDTANEVQRFTDSRVRLVRNDRNCGVIRSFERALQMASGEIMFLSDQDDVWREDKVQKTLEAFSADPRVTLVVSAVQLMDVGGKHVPDTDRNRARFRGGVVATIMKNNYQGCAMAFRRAVIDAALPFPAGIPMHDSWIGLVNEVVGQTKFLDEPLVRYRRHGQNATGNGRLSLYHRIAGRWFLSINLIKRARLLAGR